MNRTDVIRRLQSYLQTQYEGPITILAEDDDGDLTPPCAVVRVGQSDDLGINQAIVWDLNVIVAVFHDADDDTIETAETQSSEIFSELLDIDSVVSYLTNGGFLVSVWRPLTEEAGRDETKWFHAHGFQLIVAPAPEQ
jgi:hypothetical protein